MRTRYSVIVGVVASVLGCTGPEEQSAEGVARAVPAMVWVSVDRPGCVDCKVLVRADQVAAEEPRTVAVPRTTSMEPSSQEPVQDQHGEVTASFRCPDHVERLAAYTVRWTDGFLEPKLSRTRPANRPNVTTYIGDQAEFQNEYGAWTPVIYECDLNTVTGEVVDVRVRPGRLP